MSRKNSRPEWREPAKPIGAEVDDLIDDPIEDTIEVGTVVFVDGPIDPVPLAAGGHDSEDYDYPRSSANSAPEFETTADTTTIDIMPNVMDGLGDVSQNVQDKVSDVSDGLASKAQDVSDKAQDLTDKAHDVVQGAADKAQDATQKIAAIATEKAAAAKSAVGDAGSATKSIISGAAGKVSSVGTTGVQTAGTALWVLVQRSPLQALVFFASLAWLIRHNKAAASQPPISLSDAASGAAVKAGSVAGQVQAAAGTLSSQVQEQAQRGTGWFSQTLQNNPLAIGAMAIVFGAGLGFAVPESAYENRLLGKTRDSLADKAQEAAQDLGQKVQTVAQTAVHEAIEGVKEEAKNQGLAG